MPAALKRVVKHPRACQQHVHERASRSHAKPGFKGFLKDCLRVPQDFLRISERFRWLPKDPLGFLEIPERF